jgi:hypothetical protein
VSIRRVFAKANGQLIERTIPPNSWDRPVSHWLKMDKTGGLRLAFYNLSKLITPSGRILRGNPTQWPGLQRVYWDGDEPQGDDSLRDAPADNDDNDLLVDELPSAAKKDGTQKRKRPTYLRTGCRNCWQKKTKCDETRPQCQRCTTAGIKCEYGGDDISNLIPNAPFEDNGGGLDDASAGGNVRNAIVIAADDNDDLRDPPCEVI